MKGGMIMERRTYRESRGRELMERSSAEAFNRGSRGEECLEEERVVATDAPQQLRLDREPNPFLIDVEEREDRMAEMVGELQSRYEQEIQELDEAEIADAGDLKNRFLDRIFPSNARERAEHYTSERDARMYDLAIELAAAEGVEFGLREPSNDEALRLGEEEELTKKGLDFEI
jgi:hypothetical protein